MPVSTTRGARPPSSWPSPLAISPGVGDVPVLVLPRPDGTAISPERSPTNEIPTPQGRVRARPASPCASAPSAFADIRAMNLDTPVRAGELHHRRCAPQEMVHSCNYCLVKWVDDDEHISNKISHLTITACLLPLACILLYVGA